MEQHNFNFVGYEQLGTVIFNSKGLVKIALDESHIGKFNLTDYL